MHFDDRLATVLRNRAESDLGARIQYRQLLDILGEPDQRADESLLSTAWTRLAALGQAIPAAERAEILRRGGWRLSNPELIVRLVDDEADVASAALECVRLSPDGWVALIPRLPIRARGFLRLRRGLPDEAIAVLERLGVHDRGLPMPPDTAATNTEERASHDSSAASQSIPATASTAPPPSNEIASIVAKIEAFRQSRERAGSPAGGTRTQEKDEQAKAPVSFSASADGTIVAASAHAPSLVGQSLAVLLSNDVPDAATRLRHLQPFRHADTAFASPHPMAGQWTIDAEPVFDDWSGNFAGYAGVFRTRLENYEIDDPARSQAERIRKLLHELKTPVNAIQGFAEVIQQQMFGPAPHHYRSLAAQIAGDSAEMLSGFDDLDRIALLESGALRIEKGRTELLLAAQPFLRQLRSVLEPRSAKIVLLSEPGTHEVAIARPDVDRICWRLLATMTSAARSGETIEITIQRAGDSIVMRFDLPAELASEEDVFVIEAVVDQGSISAGLFGAGFALRLTRSEVRTIGGNLKREGNELVLELPAAAPVDEQPAETASAEL